MDKGTELYRELENRFKGEDLHRPLRVQRYEAGTELSYQVTSVSGRNRAQVRLAIEKFVGGGFAGQVYRVNILNIAAEDGEIEGLRMGGGYAMKILVPPSNFSLVFRNALYKIGFQGDFQLQCNPAAARAGALWQKFIRRAAKLRFGAEDAVVDIHATFVDSNLGSCGELSEWVDGRTWRLEVDDRLDLLGKWKQGKPVDESFLGSPEFRAKKVFMKRFVDLLHETGAHEFARQYEWSTCKSQPNALKRREAEGNPEKGLTAVDFRAGLALLPVLPMSPGDIPLIFKGLARGSLVQFDRGNLNTLENFVKEHPETFTGMEAMLEELKQNESIYRNSVPDITHNGARLFYSPKLWSGILNAAVNGWRIKNDIDEKAHSRFKGSPIRVFLFMLIGLVPLLGKFVRKLWGRADWRRHYLSCFSPGYLARALRGKVAESLIVWHRAGRVTEARARKIMDRPWGFWLHLPLSILPAGIHRMLTDGAYAKERFHYIAIRPVKLYFDAQLREQWLYDMVEEGRRKNLLSREDEATIRSQIKEDFIQKYLKSLAVHVCTLPITQVVSVITAGIFWIMNPDMATAERSLKVVGILAAFQLVPLSPGSLVRGLYVLYLVIRERNFKDYNIAVFLGFFKYVGYLAFPIQMTYRYPALARFMAGYWATEAVHIVPVFGEHGALLEHFVYGLFYNRPLTIRRRMSVRAEVRKALPARTWHILFAALAGGGLFAAAEYIFVQAGRPVPGLKDIWYLTLFIPLLVGALTTLGAGGAVLGKRVIYGALAGVFTGLCHTALSAVFTAPGLGMHEIIVSGVWRVFAYTIFSVIGVVVTEILLPEPEPVVSIP